MEKSDGERKKGKELGRERRGDGKREKRNEGREKRKKRRKREKMGTE